jgi:Kdo2-lipid IVA lauroyltransferase/acyltransferase
MSKITDISDRISLGLNYMGILMLKAISYLPFWFLYRVSDILALVLQYIVGYRKNVIINNIRHSFPGKSDKEVKAIVKKFYRHFSDVTFETIKGYSMSLKAFRKRINFLGIDKMDELFQNGKSILLFGMHYNNWEWSGSAQPLLKHQYLVIYNPMRNNPLFERYLLKIRERWGAKTTPVHKSARTALGLQKMQKPIALALAADQRPPVITRYWTTFLNQEACFNTGPIKIAQVSNQPVFFHMTRKIKRGYYEVSFFPLIENPANMSAPDILLTYVHTMEKYIREAPEYYLWSHRRWKQKRPADCPLL